MYITMRTVPPADIQRAHEINAMFAGHPLPNPLTAEGLGQLRAAAQASATVKSAVDRLIDGPAGKLRLRIIHPARDPRAVMYFIHGGGWFSGTPEEDDLINLRAAEAAGIVTASVDYRLAPEHAFPACLQDVYAGLDWLLENSAAALGTDKIIVGGASTGGYLAAMAVLHARDRGKSDRIVGANLAFGVYDISFGIADRLATSHTLGLSTSFLGATRQIIGSGDPKIWKDPAMNPIYADLRNLPPALFTVGDLDPLLDDSRFFAASWIAAGNKAEMDVWPAAVHGFTKVTPAIGQHAEQRINSWINGLIADADGERARLD